MNRNEENLLLGLKALAARETAAPPAASEVQLLRQFKRCRLISWPLVLEALAAAAILLIGVYSRPAQVSDAFIAVPYSMPIGPNERADLVRVNVPISALAQWGLSVSSFNPNQRVDAEVVLGEDGLARAYRLIGN